MTTQNTRRSMKVVVTGKLPGMSRSQLHAALNRVDVELQGKVTSSTHVLFDLGTARTQKRKDAERLMSQGITIDIMEQAELLSLLASGDIFESAMSEDLRVLLYPGEQTDDGAASTASPIGPPQFPAKASPFNMTF